MSGFIEAERESGIKYLSDLAATVDACWRHACVRDGIDPDSKFVVFADDNPIVLFYERALRLYLEDFAAYNAFGYTGMTMRGRAELYKRPPRRQR